MMVAEQMQTRPHGREDLVDLSLARVRPSIAGKRPERPGSFVGHEDVDVDQALARLHLLAHEMPAFVGELGGLCAALFWMGKVGRVGVVPRRRERAAESGNANLSGADGGGIRDVVQIRRQIPGCDRVEVVVVAVNPVDRSAQGFVPAVLVGDVADAQPEGNVRMAGDNRARLGERAVNVA